MSYESLIKRLLKFENSLSDTDEKRKLDELITDNTAEYFYKKLKLLKSSLSKAKSLSDDIYFTVRNINSLPNVPSNFKRYLTQAFECKSFIDNLIKDTERGICNTSCSDFIKRVSEYEPQDDILKQGSIPWSVFATTNWHMLNKWNKMKRVFSVELSWLQYLMDSIEDDMSLASLESCPYNTFGVSLNVGSDKLTSVLVDYDRVNKVINVGGFLPQQDKGELYESLYYFSLDASTTYASAFKSLKAYLMDDVNNFATLVSPRGSYWREVDFGKGVITAPFFSSRNEKGVEYITDVDCGRFMSGVIAKSRIFDRDNNNYEMKTEFGIIIGGCILMLMLFLSAENSAKSVVKREVNASEVRSSSSKGSKSKKLKAKPVEVYDVAVREVALLRKSGIITGESTKQRGISGLDMSRTVRPHMRKAHWHHYWVGRRGTSERRLVLKFIMPTLVGGDESATIDNTTLGNEK